MEEGREGEKEGDLKTKEFWDNYFQSEIKFIEDLPPESKECTELQEPWFQENTYTLISKYIKKNFSKETRILEVGAGNGLLLVLLNGYKFNNISGIDYSYKSVELCKSKLNNLNITEYKIWEEDILTTPISEENKYELINDIGTFDVIYMNKQTEEYTKAIYYRIIKGEDSRFILTSCNCTEEELLEIFGTLFVKVELMKGYKVLQFGGKIGQNLTTIIFKPK